MARVAWVSEQDIISGPKNHHPEIVTVGTLPCTSVATVLVSIQYVHSQLTYHVDGIAGYWSVREVGI